MIEIDGSYGEGGGQIIRTAVSLAAITGKSISIKKIRENRPNPGLSSQHLNAVLSVIRISDGGRVENLKLRSREIKFYPPEEIKGGRFEIDIGTAGSITLLLQCMIPVALFAENPSHVRITGGTDVAWSPPIDFYTNVFLRAIKEMGCRVEISLIRRGYYPKGGGIVEATIEPIKRLRGIILQPTVRSDGGIIEGISHCSNIPEHVAHRQKESAEKILKDNGYDTDIKTEIGRGVGRGSGIVLWKDYKSGSSLDERGKSAETVGKEAAEMMMEELKSSSSVDVHLADQLIPYIALAPSRSEISVRKVTKHIETNIYIVRKFIDSDIIVEKDEERGIFRIRKE